MDSSSIAATSAGTSPVPGNGGVTSGLILRLALPVMLASLSTPLVGAVDTAVLGHAGDPALAGGVAAATVIVNFVFFTFNFLRTSTTGIVAQALGAGQPFEADVVALRACLLALVFGGLGVALQAVVAQVGFDLLAIEGELRQAGEDYLQIRIWSAPALLLNYCFVGWLFGQGAVFRGLLLQVLLNVLNIVLSIWFVWYLDMGVRGTAWGAALAEIATALTGSVMLVVSLRQRLLKAIAAVPDWGKFASMMLVNVDLLLRSLLLFAVMALFTRQGAGFDTVTFAANVILMNLFYLSGAVMDGLATASQQLSGRFLGARNRAAFERSVRLVMIWGVLFGLVALCGYGLARDTIIKVMTASPEVQAAAFTYYFWVLITPLVGSTAFVLDGVFIGASWSRDMRNTMIASGMIFVVLMLALTPSLGNHGLWLSLLAFISARGGLLAARLRTRIKNSFPTVLS